MDSNKNYSLFSDQIEDSVSEYVATDTSLNLTVNRPTASQHVYRISRGANTGVITFYIKKTGLVSINIQGSEQLAEICERCCDYVIMKTSIPNSQKKSFSIKNCVLENFEYIKTDIDEQHGYVLKAKEVAADSNISESIIVADTHGTKVTVSIYSNGTFLMQGNVTPVFVTVMTEAIKWMLDTDNAANVSNIISLENITNTFNTDINVLIPNLSVCNDTDNIISRMVLTSVSLFNSGVIVDDYGCYTFGLLKALEGVLKLRLAVDLGMIDKLGDHFHYDSTTNSHRINTNVYDTTPHLKVAINKTYNYWRSKRHASFHADAQIAVSTLYAYEQALEVGMKALDCINEICDNW